MKNISKNVLEDLYLMQKLNPYQIAKKLSCDHKTIRKYIKLHSIPMRTASEYNYLPKVSHINPDKTLLATNKSIAGHIAYLCEGWHTNKTNVFYFCNTDANLIDLIIDVLNDIYKVKNIRLVIATPSKDKAALLTNTYVNAKVVVDPPRKTPIVRVYSGGKTLARDFIKNAYDILYSLS